MEDCKQLWEHLRKKYKKLSLTEAQIRKYWAEELKYPEKVIEAGIRTLFYNDDSPDPLASFSL